jgi:hypothetical protein
MNGGPQALLLEARKFSVYQAHALSIKMNRPNSSIKNTKETMVESIMLSLGPGCR